MDYLSIIQAPITKEMLLFNRLFNTALTHTDHLLSQVLARLRQKTGKRMRPMLILLTAKNYGEINETTQRSAVGLELLHTASLVHDDVVDESDWRRGQPSINAAYNNKVAVLTGDYLLSTALHHVSLTHNHPIVTQLAELGRVLARGEILQLSNISEQGVSEEVYYDIIKMKTAALFEGCTVIGALSVGADPREVERAKRFGQTLGVIFQIRDDIFDYFDDDGIGKPTGNDMAEGKLSLPAIYALREYPADRMLGIAAKVKNRAASGEEIAALVKYSKEKGGIDYAKDRMLDFKKEAALYINNSARDSNIRRSLTAYLDYVIEREK